MLMISYHITMLKTEKLDEILQQINDLLPQNVRETRDDIKRNLKAGVSSTLSRMDLVTRQEFDIQTELLARSRVMLEQLEQRITDLEKQLK